MPHTPSVPVPPPHPRRHHHRRAGHASLTMTVDSYGSWIPPQAQGAMDTLAGLLVTGKAACGDWTASGTIAK